MLFLLFFQSTQKGPILYTYFHSCLPCYLMLQWWFKVLCIAVPICCCFNSIFFNEIVFRPSNWDNIIVARKADLKYSVRLKWQRIRAVYHHENVCFVGDILAPHSSIFKILTTVYFQIQCNTSTVLKNHEHSYMTIEISVWYFRSVV